MRGIYKVPFHCDETSTSLAIRLAAANRLAVFPFCEDQGFSFRGVVRGESEALKRLSEISQVAPERLIRNAFVITKQGHGVLRDEAVRTPWVTRYPARVCALCLNDDLRYAQGPNSARRYYRIHWQVASIRSCEIHDAPLIELPSSGSYRNFDLDYRAMTHTRELNRALATLGTAPFTEYEKFVLRRLDGHKAASPLLDDMSLLTAIDLSELFGMYTTFGKHANLRNFGQSEWQTGTQAGFDLLSQGREGVRRFVQLMTIGSNPKRSARGGRAILGGINTGLSHVTRKGPEYDRIRADILSFLGESVALTATDKVFGQASSGSNVTIHYARRILGGSEPQVRTVLMHFAGEKDTATTVFGPSVIERAKRYLDDLVLPIDAKPILGVTRAHFEQLVERGVVFEDKVFAKLFPSQLPRYSRKELTKLVDAARATPPVGSRNGLVPLAKVGLKIHAHFTDTLSLLSQNKLTKVYYDPKLPGLASIFVDPSEVKSRFDIGADWMLADEVASLIGVGHQSIWLMTRAGILPFHSFRLPGHNHSLFFHKEEIAKFHRKYASSKGLAAEANLSNGSVGQRLRKANVEKLRAGAVVFYERTGALQALSMLASD